MGDQSLKKEYLTDFAKETKKKQFGKIVKNMFVFLVKLQCESYCEKFFFFFVGMEKKCKI